MTEPSGKTATPSRSEPEGLGDFNLAGFSLAELLLAKSLLKSLLKKLLENCCFESDIITISSVVLQNGEGQFYLPQCVTEHPWMALSGTSNPSARDCSLAATLLYVARTFDFKLNSQHPIKLNYCTPDLNFKLRCSVRKSIWRCSLPGRNSISVARRLLLFGLENSMRDLHQTVGDRLGEKV
jgi:hypothetical protein